MTAPEPTRPAAEHIDAVALMLADFDHYRRGSTLPVGTLGAVYRERAVRVLTSTDAAVHSAMLDALVRAGVLEPEGDVEWCQEHCYVRTAYGNECGDKCNEPGPHDVHECVDGHSWPYDERTDDPKPRRSRRYATSWEVIAQ